MSFEIDEGFAAFVVAGTAAGGLLVRNFAGFLSKRLHLSNDEKEHDIERDKHFLTMYNKGEERYVVLRARHDKLQEENNELRLRVVELERQVSEMQLELRECLSTNKDLRDLIELLKERYEED